VDKVATDFSVSNFSFYGKKMCTVQYVLLKLFTQQTQQLEQNWAPVSMNISVTSCNKLSVVSRDKIMVLNVTEKLW